MMTMVWITMLALVAGDGGAGPAVCPGAGPIGVVAAGSPEGWAGPSIGPVRGPRRGPSGPAGGCQADDPRDADETDPTGTTDPDDGGIEPDRSDRPGRPGSSRLPIAAAGPMEHRRVIHPLRC